MVEKELQLERLSEIDSVVKKYEFLNRVHANIEDLTESIKDFAFRVILIGGFSSGKSAFLNRLIGRPIFKEELGPETALPAEVSWAPGESCQAIFPNGESMDLPIDEATANPPKGAQYLSIRLDDKFLKEHAELILVDFPGYDSNVAAHNAAINAYLKKGCAFMLFIPAQNGALTTSDIRFIKEAATYPQALGCFISKSDVRPPEKCTEIASYIKSGISMYYGSDVPVDVISTMPDCVPDFDKRVGNMVDRFDPQILFNLSFTPAINEQLATAINAIQEYLDGLRLDCHDIEKRIIENRDILDSLNKQLEKERIALNRKYQYEIIPGIMSRLENAFHADIDMLVEAAMAGGQRFGDVAQSIARPILASVPGEIQANLRDVISRMPIEQQPDCPEDNNIANVLLTIIDVISTTIPTAGGKVAPPKMPKPGTAGMPNPSSALSGMGTGLIVGMMGNPILGAVIAIAPTLIDMIFGAKKKPSGPDPKQQARIQVETEGIPTVMQRLEEAITPAVMETRDMLFKEIEQKIRENQEAASQALEQAKAEKENEEQEHAKNQAAIQADISKLQSLLA